MPWEFPNKARVHSKRFRASSSRTSRREQKKGMTGEGKEGHACPQTPRFWKTHSPTNAASDWCGAGSVDYLAIETTIKPGMLCLRASQIWSHQNCGRRLQNALDWYLFERVCAKVYEIRIFKVLLEIEQWRLGKANFSIGNDGVRIRLEKKDCLLDITST